MRLKFAACFAGALALATVLAPIRMAAADDFTPEQKKELGAFIKDYLVNNPDVLRAAIDALDKHDKQVAEAERQKMVGNHADMLFSSKFQATVGNPRERRRSSSSSITTATIARAPLSIWRA